MDENAYQAAQRLVIIAQDIERRFDPVDGSIWVPLGLPNCIEAMRLILDRLEREAGLHKGDEKER